MSVEFANAVVAAVGSVVVVAATYGFTKKKERDAELRREKLDYYKAFVQSFGGAMKNESSASGMKAYSQACNNLLLFAPQTVIEAVQQFERERSNGRKISNEKHDQLLSKVLLEIRKDLKVSPKDNSESFHVSLWSPAIAIDRQNITFPQNSDSE